MTVELRHSEFLTKLDAVRKGMPIDARTDISAIFNQINNYETDVVLELCHYYCDLPNDYEFFMTSNDYYGKLDRCMKYIGIQETLAKTKLSREVYDFCCEKMNLHNEELVCPKCGKVRAVIESELIYETPKSYDQTKHCKFWVDRIQALNSKDIPKKIIDDVVYCSKRDNMQKLSCPQIRCYLKETRNSDYNDYVPLIRKIITGISPPQLTEGELRKLYNMFSKATAVESTGNTVYYPYLILKCLEHILKKGKRKNKIIECIHLQSRETLIANDILWEGLKICKFKPTDRYELLQS